MKQTIFHTQIKIGEALPSIESNIDICHTTFCVSLWKISEANYETSSCVSQL